MSNPPVVVIGAGGHAKVCIEILRSAGETVAYCIGTNDAPPHCLNVDVLLGDHHLAHLREQGYHRVFVAIGSNALRDRLANLALKQGYDLINAVSSHAIISPSAALGRGIAVMPGAVINAESFIHDLAIINTGATIDHDCRIGRATHIAPQSALAGTVTVGTRSFLGIGCRVIPNIHIGDCVTVGAGAVVVQDLPSNVTAVGIPAKITPRH